MIKRLRSAFAFSGGSRRNNRLFWRQVRGWVLSVTAVALVMGAVIYGYVTGSFGLARDWVVAESLEISRTAGFKVEDIIVTGRVHADMEAIERAVAIPKNAPILALDVQQMKTSLEQVPWVHTAQVTRQLPNTVRIELSERQAVALWQYQKKLTLIDAQGVALREDHLRSFAGLPLLIGEGAPEKAADLLRLLAAEPELARYIVSCSRIGGRRWDMSFSTGVTVKMPEYNIELALRRLAAAQETHNILGQELSVIDLRQPEKMILTPGPAKPVASRESSRT